MTLCAACVCTGYPASRRGSNFRRLHSLCSKRRGEPWLISSLAAAKLSSAKLQQNLHVANPAFPAASALAPSHAFTSPCFQAALIRASNLQGTWDVDTCACLTSGDQMHDQHDLASSAAIAQPADKCMTSMTLLSTSSDQMHVTCSLRATSQGQQPHTHTRRF